MTTFSPDRRPMVPSLQRPPISGLPAPPPISVRVPGRERNVLLEHVENTRSWGREHQELPPSVTWALWVVLVGAGGIGGWLTAVRTGHAPGRGPVYALATLGHPGLLMICAGICVGTLLILVPFTYGLARAGWPELTAMTVAGVAGVVSVLGVVLVAVLVVVAAFLAVALLIAVVERT